MSTRRDPDRLIHEFLLEGSERLHDQVYDAVRADIDHRRQRVVIGPWRLPTVNKLVPIGLGAAAVVALLFAGAQLLGPRVEPGGVGGQPAATPPPAASPSPPEVPAGVPEGAFVIREPRGGMPGVTVTIPAPGWDHLAEFDAVQKGVEVANVPEAAILFWPFAAGTEFFVYGDPCRAESTRPSNPVTTFDEIVDLLGAQASRDATEPTAVTVGGHAGRSITLHVPADADFDACEQREFASYGTGDDLFARTQQGPGQIDELWVVDVDGAIVVIDAMYRADSAPDLVEEMRTIAESATFTAAP